MTWTPPLPATVHTKPGKKIDVVLVDGRKFRADSGRVATDILVLYRPQMTDTLPVSQVKKIESRHFNILKTAGLIVVLFFGMVVTLAAILCADQPSCKD